MEDTMNQLLCTNDTASDCSGCSNSGYINCKRDTSVLLGFFAAVIPPGLIAIFGLVLTGNISGMWWPLISYGVYYAIMVAVIEPIFLCSHCPFYAAPGRTLHCHANEGSLKLRKSQPGPMNKLEKTLMVFFGASIFIWPGIFIGYTLWAFPQSIQYSFIGMFGISGIAGAFLISSVACIYIVGKFLCSKCVNFSCPFNLVPKKYVDQYLKKNPVMMEAWKKTGYSID